MRTCGLLIIGVGSDISNVGIRQADDLPGVTRIGKNFLISREAGIKNDFAAASRNRSRGAAMKNAPVFERKNSLPCFRFRQWTLSPAGFTDY
jgi:hypothetical protein